MPRFARNDGFTLAEVLITLVIIGVVAALTVPVMYNKFQQEYKITRIKKAYADVQQALKMAEVRNGTMDTWDMKRDELKPAAQNFAHNYLLPNMSLMKVCSPSTSECYYNDNSDSHVSAISNAGYSFVCWVDLTGYGGWINVDIDGPKKGKNQNGSDKFEFKVVFKNGVDTADNQIKKGVFPSGLQYVNPIPREELLEKAKTNKAYCAGLLAKDSWHVLPDNPCSF